MIPSHWQTFQGCQSLLEFFDDREHLYLKFPETRREMLLASDEWFEKIGQPFCIGAMDGTHLAIRRPYFNEPAYLNRKGYYSLNAMVNIYMLLYSFNYLNYEL